MATITIMTEHYGICLKQETLAFILILNLSLFPSPNTIDLLSHFNAQWYGERSSAPAEGQGNHHFIYCSSQFGLFTDRIASWVVPAGRVRYQSASLKLAFI